jgi:hypothetical protein
VIAVVLIVMLVVTGALFAASLHLSTFVSSVLALYLIVAAEVTGLTWALSPMQLVTRTGVAVAESALLVGAFALWMLGGRPRFPFGRVRSVRAELSGNWLVRWFVLCVAVALAYELVLGLVVPPNNWDSLTYHLARATAWAHHGGIYWIPNAPTDRMNEFQTGAEQQLLYLFVVTGKAALYALPQFVAQLAILVAVYGAARRTGGGVRPAICAALFFATLSVVALESTTSQNDLVAASFPVCAFALLLGGAYSEIALAGTAVALGLGVKLTTALVLPAVVFAAWRLGRLRFALFGLSAAVAFAAFSTWSFVLNTAETGHVLGHGGGRLEDSASPSFPGSVATFVRVVHRLFDISGYGPLTLTLLTGCALIVSLAVLLAARTPRLRNSGLASSGAAAIPLLAPVLVVVGAFVLQGIARAVHLPVNDPKTTVARFSWRINSASDEDLSSFGPLGGLAIIGLSTWTIIEGMRRRVGVTWLALGLAVPAFVVLFSLVSKFNPWVSRFLIVPVALMAPLFALLFRSRHVAVAIVGVGVLSTVLVLANNQLKPLVHTHYRPWQLTQARAVRLNWGWGRGGAATVEQINRRVPARACIGALLGGDEPSFLLYGPGQRRDVIYLPRRAGAAAARRDGLGYVVIATPPHSAAIIAGFASDGWTLRRLPRLDTGRHWTLAIRQVTATASCMA